jgi:hypothetical protein
VFPLAYSSLEMVFPSSWYIIPGGNTTTLLEQHSF